MKRMLGLAELVDVFIFHLYLEGGGWVGLGNDLDLHFIKAHDHALFLGISLGMTDISR